MTASRTSPADESRALVEKAFTLDESVIMRGITSGGIIHLFSDSRHATLEISKSGASRNTTEHAQGVPLTDLETEINEALSNPDTIGIAPVSSRVYEHLESTGQIDRTARTYKRGNRIYHLF